MFKNRRQAGKLLGQKIIEDLGDNIQDQEKDIVVLGIPRGGVITAKEIADLLNCPLDVIVTKKINPPKRLELAIGAVGETGGAEYLNKELIKDLEVDKDSLQEEIEDKKEEVRRREKIFRKTRNALDLKGKTVIIADDGAATGATVIAAAREVWNNEPQSVVIAVPVLARETLHQLEQEADKVFFLKAPKLFFAVGQFYKIFSQVPDKTVIKILNKK